MKTVAIIPCTNQKADNPGLARSVWTGSHFQLTLAYTERFHTLVRILSFKYGLITPETYIEPYDINIQFKPAAERLKWWWLVRDHIVELASNEKPDLVAIYTGSYERDRLIRDFVRAGVTNVVTPWKGLSVGLRMQRIYDGTPPFDVDKFEKGVYTVNMEELERRLIGRKPETEFVAEDLEWID